MAAVPEEDLLAAAFNEISYFDFSRGYDFFSKALNAAKPGTLSWQQAILGKAICAQHRTPCGPEAIKEAIRLNDELIQTSPSSPYARRAMLNLGRIAELVDYYRDPVDLEQARKWYRKVAEMKPEPPEAGEAVLRLAGAFIQTYDEPQVREGIRILEEWLQAHPREPLAALMWQYLGDTWYLPLNAYAKALDCYLEADRLGIMEKGREGLLYWRMAVLADRWLHNREVAVQYYTKIITQTPTSGMGYEAQLALKRLGAPVPEIAIFQTAAAAKEGPP